MATNHQPSTDRPVVVDYRSHRLRAEAMRRNQTVGWVHKRLRWLALALTITLVLAAEGVNTAVEAVVDLVTPGFHPLAKIAKDVAAGTVLLTAIGAVVVGVIIFLPRLWTLAAPWVIGAL
jgi:hypothetical protein